MKKKLTIIVFTLLASYLFAQNLSVNIAYHDKKVYYTDAGSAVLVRVSLTNRGGETVYFKLADNHEFSLDFTAIDTKNKNVARTEAWLRNMNTNNRVYFRDVSLEPGETYSFIENVKDFLKFETPGVYILQCAFFSDLRFKSDLSEAHILSNRLTLEIKPSLGPLSIGTLPVSESNNDILQAQAIPPDQVITYMLNARQKSYWEQFFLYIDLERLIQKNPSKSKRYTAESEMGRIQMLNEFRQQLRQSKIEQSIVMLPSDFKIERTTYNDTEAEVKVIEWFSYSNFKEKKRYTYSLSSRDGVWTVYDYVVENLGTE
ncbi:MAG: hypothetical protein P1P63_01815 [Treponemataceae bacterium]